MLANKNGFLPQIEILTNFVIFLYVKSIIDTLLICIAVGGYILWTRKTKSDIEAIRKGIVVGATGACTDPPAYADCYDKRMLDKYGYVRTKELMSFMIDASPEEQKFMDECKCK